MNQCNLSTNLYLNNNYNWNVIYFIVSIYRFFTAAGTSTMFIQGLRGLRHAFIKTRPRINFLVTINNSKMVKKKVFPEIMNRQYNIKTFYTFEKEWRQTKQSTINNIAGTCQWWLLGIFKGRYIKSEFQPRNNQ